MGSAHQIFEIICSIAKRSVGPASVVQRGIYCHSVMFSIRGRGLLGAQKGCPRCSNRRRTVRPTPLNQGLRELIN